MRSRHPSGDGPRSLIPPQCLTIAGSDSGGGAGIQADLKAFHANGVFGMSVVTSVTAQNTQRVTKAFDLPPDIIRAQLEAVFGDFDIAAVKTGMLSSRTIAAVVAEFWQMLHSPPPLVMDPVMVSKSGFSLLAEDAVEMIRDRMLPLAELVTPNRHEAELLAGIPIEDRASLEEAGRRILGLGPRAVLIKGGHLEGRGLDPDHAVDYLFQEGALDTFRSDRYDNASTHGTGCTYSAAIAAWLGRGESLAEAVQRAKTYITGAVRYGLRIGRGHGPTNHFYFLDDPARLH